MAYRILAAIFGWVWLFSIPVTLGLLVAAIFFDGSWMAAGASFLVGGVAKWLLRGFADHVERLAIERQLIEKGLPKNLAEDAWMHAYGKGGAGAARRLVNDPRLTDMMLNAYKRDGDRGVQNLFTLADLS